MKTLLIFVPPTKWISCIRPSLMTTLLWVYFQGTPFVWVNITPIEAPSIFVRVFYSALTFVTLGAFLYWIRFYQFLYHLLGDYRSFKEAKALIWLGLMALMFFVIVPTVVNLLNGIISFGYNLIALLVYLFPPIGITLILSFIYLYLSKKYLVRDASI